MGLEMMMRVATKLKRNSLKADKFQKGIEQTFNPFFCFNYSKNSIASTMITLDKLEIIGYFAVLQ